MMHRTRGLPVLPALLVAAATPAGQERAPSPGAWRTFEGSWSGSGQRQTLPIGGTGEAATVQLSGAIVLTVGEGLSRGFRGEVIAYGDGVSLSVGRAVWTDERGVAATFAGMAALWAAAGSLGLAVAYVLLHYLFVSQTAQVLALFGVFLDVGMELGVPAAPLAFLLLFASNFVSVITPQGSRANLLFAGSGYLSQGELYRLGAITTGASLLVYLLVGTPWLMLVTR